MENGCQTNSVMNHIIYLDAERAASLPVDHARSELYASSYSVMKPGIMCKYGSRNLMHILAFLKLSLMLNDISIFFFIKPISNICPLKSFVLQ